MDDVWQDVMPYGATRPLEPKEQFDKSVIGRTERIAAYTLYARRVCNPTWSAGRERLKTLTVALDASSVGGRRILLVVAAAFDNVAVSCWPQVTFLGALNTDIENQFTAYLFVFF